MVAFTNGFDATMFAPQYGGAGGLVDGVHPVIISNSEWQIPKPDAKGGQGHMLVLTLEAYDGPAKGSSQKDYLLLYSNDQEQVGRACKKLAAYCQVLNVPRFTDSTQLHNIAFLCRTAKQKDNDFQEIKDIMFANGARVGSNGIAPAGPGAGGPGNMPAGPGPGAVQQQQVGPGPGAFPGQQAGPGPGPQAGPGAGPGPGLPTTWQPQQQQAGPGPGPSPGPGPGPAAGPGGWQSPGAATQPAAAGPPANNGWPQAGAAAGPAAGGAWGR